MALKKREREIYWITNIAYPECLWWIHYILYTWTKQTYNTMAITSKRWLVTFYMYKVLDEISFNINIHETSLRNVFKWASGKLYNVSGTSFIKVYTSVRSFLSRDSGRTDPLLDTVSTAFLACDIIKGWKWAKRSRCYSLFSL